PQVQFLARGTDYTTYLTATEAVLTLRRPDSRTTRDVLHMQLVGSNPRAQATRLDQLPGRISYFIGRDPRRWQSNLPTFARTSFADVYPGIDLVYYGTAQGQLEFDFVVRPGASTGAIRLTYANTQPLTVDAQGHLSLRLDGSTVIQRAPSLYQLN